MEITQANLNFIFFGFDLRYQAAYEQAPTFYEKIATVTPSKSRETHYGWIAKLPSMRQWLGEKVINAVGTYEYTLKNLPFESTVSVNKYDIRDDQYGLLNPVVDMLGISAKQWPDTTLTTLIETGTAATALCFDGLPFFSASHPRDPNAPGSTTYSNYKATATSGTFPLNVANYTTARATMMGYRGEDNQPLGVIPSLLMVPPALGVTARTILNAEIIATQVSSGSGTTSAAPQTNVLKGTADVLENPFLTSDTAWYLLCGRFPIRPFVWQTRDALEFIFLNKPTDPNAFYRKEYIMGVEARGNAGFGLPFLAFKGDV